MLQFGCVWVMEKMVGKKVHKGGYVVEHIAPTTCYVNVVNV
jgi:hypothetical protein